MTVEEVFNKLWKEPPTKELNDNGELSIASLLSLNTSEAHFMAMATDSGLPPRQASVPITVHFPAAAIRAANTWSVGGTSFIMVAIFSTLLVILLLVIAALGFQIHKGKRRKKVEDSSVKSNSSAETEYKGSDSSSGSHNLNHLGSDMEGKVLSVGTLPVRNPHYTATVKSIMSRTGSSRSFHPPLPGPSFTTKPRIAPAPPLPPPQILEEEEECTCSLGSREWVDGSIPRRVKKLSWDDESQDNDNIRNLEDSLEDSSHEPKEIIRIPNENIKLTVYF